MPVSVTLHVFWPLKTSSRNRDLIKSVLRAGPKLFLMNDQRSLSMIHNKNKSLLEKDSREIKNNLIPCQTLKTQCVEFYFTNKSCSYCFFIDSEGEPEKGTLGSCTRARPVERLQVIDIVRLKSRLGNIRRGCEWSQEKQIFHFHRDQQTFLLQAARFFTDFL